jgi:hypothetical protein
MGDKPAMTKEQFGELFEWISILIRVSIAQHDHPNDARYCMTLGAEAAAATEWARRRLTEGSEL